MVDLIVPPSLRASHTRGFQRYAETGESTLLGRRVEVQAMRADGSEFPMELSVAVVDVPGEVVFTAYLRDISDQKRREEALLANEAIVHSSFDAIIGRTPDGIVTSWNEAAERIFGYRADEMIGRHVGHVVAPESGAVLAHVNECLARGEVVPPLEAVCVRKDGRRIAVEATVSPIAGASGEALGVSAIVRDISERKHAQAIAGGQAELLELVAGGAALRDVLDRLARFVEAHGEGVVASIQLLDPDGVHLRHGAAPSLPDFYREAIEGIEIGPDAGSFGPKTARRERVCVAHIATDPRWSAFREPAARAGLATCWWTPILATDGRLLGTFALYYREARDAGEGDIELVELATHVAGIAIERASSEEAARASDDRYRDLFENANEPIATVTMDEQITEVNQAFERVLGYSATSSSAPTWPSTRRRTGSRRHGARRRKSSRARSPGRRSSRSSWPGTGTP